MNTIEPYLTRIIKVREYNPEYGDDRTCECGHPYYRHFDSYDDMSDIGCKYCQCYDFKEIEIGKVKNKQERKFIKKNLSEMLLESCMHSPKGCDSSCNGPKFRVETVNENLETYEESIYLNGSIRFCSSDSALIWCLDSLPNQEEYYYISCDSEYYRVKILDVTSEKLDEKFSVEKILIWYT